MRGILWTPPQGLLDYAKAALGVFPLAALHIKERCQMKVSVRKFSDGSRSYLCTRAVGDIKVAHRFTLRAEQKLSEADLVGARKALSDGLLNGLRLRAAQVNPGQGE